MRYQFYILKVSILVFAIFYALVVFATGTTERQIFIANDRNFQITVVMTGRDRNCIPDYLYPNPPEIRIPAGGEVTISFRHRCQPHSRAHIDYRVMSGGQIATIHYVSSNAPSNRIRVTPSPSRAVTYQPEGNDEIKSGIRFTRIQGN